MTGVGLASAQLEDVTFRGCRLDLASLRFARLVRVRFESCAMPEVDLQDAVLESVELADCDLTGARLASATFANCTLRRCSLDGIVNAERLAGVRLPLSDALASVETLAAAARIELVPDDER